MGLEKGEEKGKEARSSWGDEIFAIHLFLHLQQAEEVQVLGTSVIRLLSRDQLDKQTGCSLKCKL